MNHEGKGDHKNLLQPPPPHHPLLFFPMMQPTTTITTPQLLACVYAVLALAGNASAVAPSGGGDYLSEIVVGKAVDLKYSSR